MHLHYAIDAPVQIFMHKSAMQMQHARDLQRAVGGGGGGSGGAGMSLNHFILNISTAFVQISIFSDIDRDNFSAKIC